jgi:beta-N-acetylhexosaminidase
MKAVLLLFLSLVLAVAAHATTAVQQQLAVLTAASQGKRIGLITNPSGCDEYGNLDADYLIYTNGATVGAFFAPEHGLRGTLPPGGSGGDYIDPQTGIPVYAVYGVRNAPTEAQLALVDLLVFDLQDVGVRFYTFVWTMTHCMEAAARNGKPFFVIDRPNPIGGMRVEGAPNPLDYGLIGRLGPGATFGVATRHGMTAGEIAWLWNTEAMNPKVELHVIPVPGWSRSQWWSETGRQFIPPSPNMRTTNTATVYPGTCIFEGSNLSVGRGTDKPFEKIGAPFVNGAAWANCLNTNNLPGVRFDAITFTPTNSVWSGSLCGGVLVVVTNRDTFDPIRTGLRMMQVLYQLQPSQVNITSYAADLMGVPGLSSSIKTQSVDSIIAGWQPTLSLFRALRRSYLLYPETPPRLEVPRRSGPADDRVEVSWVAIKNRTYRLWRREGLVGAWSDLGPRAGEGGRLTVTNTLSAPESFFCLELLP